MYQTYKDDAGFLFVYISEAHPEDGWQMESNTENDVVFTRPKSLVERRGIAKKCSTRLKLSMPVVVDTMDNKVDIQYAAWPERMFVVDRDGKIAYAAGQGPWGFKPKAAERALKKLLKRG